MDSGVCRHVSLHSHVRFISSFSSNKMYAVYVNELMNGMYIKCKEVTCECVQCM